MLLLLLLLPILLDGRFVVALLVVVGVGVVVDVGTDDLRMDVVEVDVLLWVDIVGAPFSDDVMEFGSVTAPSGVL